MSLYTAFTRAFTPFPAPPFTKLDSCTWHNVIIDTWRSPSEPHYNQLVAYVTTQDGEELVLVRRDVKPAEVGDLDFHNERRRLYHNVIRAVFHGFVDMLAFGLTQAQLVQAQQVVQPFDPANGSFHESFHYSDQLDMGGWTLHWRVKSSKATYGGFKQSVRFFIPDDATGTERAFIIRLPATTQPYVSIAELYEQHQDTIKSALGIYPLAT